MRSKLASITLIFENCQSCNVDVKHVSRIFLRDIREEIIVQNSDVFENTYCDHLKIILVDYAGIKYDGFCEKRNLMQRLFLLDVTGITLEYDNGTEKTFHPPWEKKKITNLNINMLKKNLGEQVRSI